MTYKKNERTKQINSEKEKITACLIANNADSSIVNYYRKTALTYAIDFHNIPVINLYYKLYEMNDKIIHEEDSDAEIEIPPISTELTTYKSIVEISEATTKAGTELMQNNAESPLAAEYDQDSSMYLSAA
jgi:hypothetical protein